jgi:CP family cyanate transporter-like MFS transporter
LTRSHLPGLLISVTGVILVGLNLRIAITSIPPLLASLGLGGTAQSLLVTLPVLCFAAGAPAGPRVRRLLGEEKAIFFLMSLLMVAIAVRGAFPSVALFPATLACALSIAVVNVHIPSLVKRRFPDRPGPIMSLYTTAFLLGAGIAAWLALPAKEALGNSLRMGLGIWTLPAALALVVWFPQLRVEKQAVPTTRDGDKSSVWRNPIAWQVTVFLGTSSLIFFGVFSWLPQIDTSRGISTSTSGYLLLLAIVFGIVGSLGMPTLARRFGDQRPAVVVASLIQMVGFLGLFLAPAQTAIFWAAVFGVGNGGTLSLALLLIVLRSADEHVAARLSSMAQAAGYLIAATGPLVTGLLHELLGGWSASIWFLMLAGLACLLAGFSAGYDRVVGGAPVSAAS